MAVLGLWDVVRPRAGTDLPPSLYRLQDRAGRRRWPALTGGALADVAVIGAGFTGLAAALALAEGGARVVVLEAAEPGWGASGRNGGQVNPGLKPDPDEIEAAWGAEAAAPAIRFAHRAPDRVFALIARHGIEAEARRAGGYRAAQGSAELAALEGLRRQLAAYGIGLEPRDAAQMRAATGSGAWAGGLFDPSAGQLHPLKYVRGLARAAQEAGAAIHGASPVTRMERAGGVWRLHTPVASLRAPRVVLATNGYSGPLMPRLARSVLPVWSAILASAPLPGALRARLLPRGEVLFDVGLETVYLRVDAEGRLLFGGRGPLRDAGGVQPLARLAARAAQLWPELAGHPWEFGWSGRLALTRDHLPHLHDFGDGRLAMLGYNGRGVALATAMGSELAAMILDPAHRPALPAAPLRPIPAQPLWRLGALPALALARLRRPPG